jgi:hypothetical protein
VLVLARDCSCSDLFLEGVLAAPSVTGDATAGADAAGTEIDMLFLRKRS